MVDKIAKFSFWSAVVLFSLIGVFLVGLVLAGEGYEIGWDNSYTDAFGENMTFVGGVIDIGGTANITGLANWTIVLWNSSGIVNESLCFNNTEEDNFCEWNTTEYCSTECVNYSIVLVVANGTGNYNDTIENITIDNASPDVGNISISDSDDGYTANASINISDNYLAWVSSYLFNSSLEGEENVGGYLYFGWEYIDNKTQSAGLPKSGEYEVSWDKKRYLINDTIVSVYSMGFCEDYLFVSGCFNESGYTDNYDCGGWYMAFNSTPTGSDYEFLGIWNFLDWLEQEGDECNINTSLISNDSVFLVQFDYFNSSGDDMDFLERWTYNNATNISLYNMSESDLNLNLTSESVILGNYGFMFFALDMGLNMDNGNGLESFEISGLDVSVSKTLLNEGNVLLGDTVQYLINITNTGAVNITNISLIDNWDVSLNYTTSNLIGNVTNYTNRSVVWENISLIELGVGDSYSVYVNFSAVGWAPQVSNTANVTVYGNGDSLNEMGSSQISIYGVLSDCGTISSSGVHYLNKDISSNGPCVTISASNVTLDCQGYTINHSTMGSGTYGLIAENQTNITIKNCVINQENITVNDVEYGVYFSNVTNSTIYNNTITLGNSSVSLGSGVYFGDGSVYGNISFNTIEINSDGVCFGIYLANESNYADIYNNEITASGDVVSFGVVIGSSEINVSYCNIFTNNVTSYNGTNGSSAITLAGVENVVYNNILNASELNYVYVTDKPVYIYNNYSNNFNTTKTSGANIVGKNYIGGNYYTNPSGTGYSDTCTEATGDYICDSSYELAENNVDYLPLSLSTSYVEDDDDDNGGGSGGSGGAGGAVSNVSVLKKSQLWSLITPGVAVIMKEFDFEIGVKQIIINVNNSAQNVRITVTKHDGKPAEVFVEKSGKVYQYIQIEATNLENKMENASIRLRVQNSWMQNNNLAKENIALFRYNGGAKKWDEIETIYVEKDNEYVYYDVDLNGFSYFAIAEKESIPVVETPEADEKTDTLGIAKGSLWWVGILVVVVLAVVVVVFFLLKGNKKK